MAVLSVITSLALTIAVAGAPNQVPHSVPAEPIKVVSTSHEVHFPGDVVFRLEAESSATITRITLFYRLAGRNIKVYGYPEFTPDTSVSAEFKLKTSGTGYLPSGVDIEYYYVITDADGNTIETDRLSLEYKDPRFSWRELRRGDLIVVYHDIPSSKVEAAAARVSDRLEAVKELFGVESVTPMKAVIVNGLREAESVFPFISETAGRAHVFGGFAYDSYNLFLLAGLWEDGMVHELAHLLLDQAVDSPRARIPAWLNEGLAMYFELNSRRQPTVERAARSGSLLRLRYMKTVPGQAP